jgi:hypothetical protein
VDARVPSLRLGPQQSGSLRLRRKGRWETQEFGPASCADPPPVPFQSEFSKVVGQYLNPVEPGHGIDPVEQMAGHGEASVAYGAIGSPLSPIQIVNRSGVFDSGC